MKVGIWTILFCVAGLGFVQADSEETHVVEEDDLGLYSTTEDPGDRLITNFLKVMSAILARLSVPKEVQQATKIVMRETLNGQPEAAGYKSYLVTSMLRVINNSTGVQLRNMLTIMQESSPPESPMAAAVKVLLDWLQSENGRKFINYVVDYVRNLFQTLKRRIAGNRVKPNSEPETSSDKLLFNFDNLNILRGTRTVGQGQGYNEDGSYRRPPNHQSKPQRPQKPHNQGDNHGGHRPQHPRPPHHNEDNHGGHRPQRPPHHPDHGHRPEHHPDRPHHAQRPHHPQRPNHPHHPNRDKICFERVPDYDYEEFFFGGPFIYV